MCTVRRTGVEDRYGERERGSGYREEWKQVGKRGPSGGIHMYMCTQRLGGRGGLDRGWWREDGGGRVMEGRDGETEESGLRK